ncbi:hypothetical protein AURDEDRAFT_187152 [Auricularia subglabra TFB-10046 SS5]|nr:hypothetical protein AURDEDRAFT_187152 [Auricularia subglabra TFB-10046 SS5]
MNVSFDDTSAYITFSPEWRVQPPDDPTRASSWQSTYHASQSAGASAKLTFNGAGIYLYGSKGPGHANYSVNIDDRVFYLPAYSPTQMFQQLLFGMDLRQGAYTLVLTNESKDPEAWLDIDFFMVTTPLPDGVQPQSNPGSFPTTRTVAGSNTLPPPPTQSSQSDNSSTGSSSSSSQQLPKILAIVFGALFALSLAGIALYCLLSRLAARRRAEQEFRYGTNTNTTGRSLGAATPLYTHHANTPFDGGLDIARSGASSPVTTAPPSVVQIGRSVALLDAENVPFPRAHSSLSHATSFSNSSYGQPLSHAAHGPRESMLSAGASSERGGKGKEWRAGAGAKAPRTWNGGAPSIKTFVQVMDE